MAIEIDTSAPVGADLRRVILDRVEASIASLAGRAEDRDGAVHEARKAMRSARAVLRLCRKELGESGYRSRNAVLRQASQFLSPHRDAHVRLETIRKLIERTGEDDERAPELLRRIEDRLTIMNGDLEAAAVRAEAMLQGYRSVLEPWPEGLADGATLVGKGLKRSYKKVRRRLAEAENDRAPERLHELRKRGKDVREQLRVLRAFDPEFIDGLESKFKDLCDDLGEARDLQLVGALLADELKNWPGGKPLIVRLLRAGEKREARLVRRGIRHAREATSVGASSLREMVERGWDA